MTSLSVLLFFVVVLIGPQLAWASPPPFWQKFFYNATVLLVFSYLIATVSAFFISNESIEKDLRTTIRNVQNENLERQRIEVELKQAKLNAESANAAKSNFLAHMSHEIRTPISIILGNAELMNMNQTEQKPVNPRHLDAINRNAEYLLNLIGDILDISQIEDGEIKIRRTSFDLVAEVSETLAQLRSQADTKGLQLTTEFDPDLPEFIHSDPIRLRQILVNVVGNALKFTESGAVVVRLQRSLNPEKRSTDIKIQVSDTGIGISGDHQAQLFQPFRQGDSSTSRKYGGTGLGLYLSKNIANSLGGDIRLDDSAERTGSTFEITIDTGIKNIPETITYQGACKMDHDLKADIMTGPLTGYNVLVADDNEDNQKLIQQFLEHSGAKVTLAANGFEAVEKARTGAFSAVLMDIQMPKKDGYQATKELLNAGVTTPIIAVTAHAFRFDRQRCLDAGCVDFIAKPVSMTGLVDTLKKWVI